MVKPLEVLLVDDCRADQRLTQEAFNHASVPGRLCVVNDGEEALDFLQHRGPYACARRLGLILLDLNMPRKDGRQLMADIKTDPDLKTIPVVIVTTFTADKDVADAYRLHSNSAVTKPIGFTEFVDVIRSILQFWLTYARLPPYRN